MSFDFIYLASGSPRRRELLEQIGVPFRVLGTTVDETLLPGEAPPQYVSRLAAAKAQAGWASCGAAAVIPVLAADTAVIVDGAILGKPSQRRDGLDMLRRLSERRHEVLTAVALRTSGGLESRLSRSEVAFRAICAQEAEAYWQSGEPCDKAGAYAIQGRAARFITHLSGSYSGVMGLPLFETAELLERAGIAPWRSA